MILSLRALGVLALLVCIAVGCVAGQAHKSHAESALAALKAIDGDLTESVASKSRRMSEAWSKEVERLLAHPHGASNDELNAAFSATDLVLFYATLAGDAKADAWLDRLVAIHSSLRQRQSSGGEQTAQLFKHLVVLRRFDEARALRDADPSLRNVTVPTVRFAADFRDDAPATMTRRADGAWDVANVSLADVGMVAVVGSQASAKAVAALATDATLAEKLDGAGVVWLADASALFAVDPWNAELPEQPLQVAWRNSAWKGIAFDAMPSFFFLREGRVVATETADWNDHATQANLHATLDRLR
jgi:hypothetical protein